MSGNTSSSGGYLQPISAPPVDDDALNAILHDFVVGVTGLGNTFVFPRWQPQPPTMPPALTNWAAIGVTQINSITPWPEQLHVPGPHAPTGTDSYTVQLQIYDLEVTASFYGALAGQYASMFQDGMTIRQNLEALGTNGIKLRGTGQIVHAPELVNTQWVNRYDVSFRITRLMPRTYAILDVIQSTSTITADPNSVTVASTP